MASITKEGVPIYRDDADKAACIAILRANGKDETAKDLIATVKVGRLLPEEAALLKE